MALNSIAKVVLLVIATAVAYTFWERRDNGRYVYTVSPATEHAVWSQYVVDTRTGTIYTLLEKQLVEMNMQTGELRQHPIILPK